GRFLPLHGVEHVHEHVVVPELIQFITYRKDPAGVAFGFFGDIICSLSSGEHVEARPEETVNPDRPLTSHDLITKIETAAECPAHLKLADGAVLIFHQSDGVIFCIDWLHLGVCPAHHFNRPDVFAYVASRYLH